MQTLRLIEMSKWSATRKTGQKFVSSFILFFFCKIQKKKKHVRITSSSCSVHLAGLMMRHLSVRWGGFFGQQQPKSLKWVECYIDEQREKERRGDYIWKYIKRTVSFALWHSVYSIPPSLWPRLSSIPLLLREEPGTWGPLPRESVDLPH